MWVWQNGGEVFDQFNAPLPPGKVLVNSPEAAGGVQFFADLINKEQVTPAFEQMDSSDKIAKLFSQGKVAMAFGSHVQVPAYSKVPELRWDVVPLPQGKQRVNVIGGAGYTVNVNSTHKPEAWTFLKFLSSDLGQSLFASTGLLVPARQSIREDNIFLKTTKYNSQVFLDETQVGREYPVFLGSQEADRVMDEALQPVWKGKSKASDVFADLPGKVEPIFDKARR